MPIAISTRIREADRREAFAALDVEIGLVGHRFQTAWIERSEDVKGTAVDRGLSLDAVPCADGGAELVADPIGQLTERGEGAGVQVRSEERRVGKACVS